MIFSDIAWPQRLVRLWIRSSDDSLSKNTPELPRWVSEWSSDVQSVKAYRAIALPLYLSTQADGTLHRGCYFRIVKVLENTGVKSTRTNASSPAIFERKLPEGRQVVLLGL